MSDSATLAAYHEAQAATAEACHALDAGLQAMRGFLADLESASHHLAFHGDGSYTRGEACTITLEQQPSLEALIALRTAWELARDRERELYSGLSSEERVGLASGPR